MLANTLKNRPFVRESTMTGQRGKLTTVERASLDKEDLKPIGFQ